MAIPEGIFDNFPSPDKLDARVISLSPDPAIHGYSVFSDLALHYNFSEMIYLTLTGKTPTRQIGQAFEYALKFLFPITAAEAPSNAGILAMVLAGAPASVLGTTGVLLVDMARYWVEKHKALLSWLDSPDATFPEQYQNKDIENKKIVLQLSEIISQIGISCPIFEHDPTLIAALIAVLHACGLKKPEQIQAVIVFAKYPCAIAEGYATTPYDCNSYPMRVPDYKYQQGEI